ncbi:hypothetical protein B0H13DRAFT_2300414 [Mycena leptocephala]|nr:hypothetical protein B0H13DRAFT_2300414 [Mycena leptocephala]
MSYASSFLSPLPPDHEESFAHSGTGGDSDGGGVLGSKGRVLSLRDQEALGMWAATMKVMAGTQMLLPMTPTFIPVALPHPRSRHYSHPSPSYPTPPPGTPLSIQSRTKLPRARASAACTKLMRVAAALERRHNAERRLRRRNPPRPLPVRVASAAAASTAASVRDSSRCRAATAPLPRPPSLSPDNFVGHLSDASPLPPPLPVADSPVPSEFRSYVRLSARMSTPAHNQHLPLLVMITAVDTSDTPDDSNTTYCVISDPFARSLARLLPVNFERERKLTRAIYLDELWKKRLLWAEWFDSGHLPPTQRVYLNALAEIFRPWQDPLRGHSLALNLNPVYNLFTQPN